MNYYKNLFDLVKEDNMQYGNKASRLGILHKKGIRIPKGICLSVDFYALVENDQLSPQALKILKSIYHTLEKPLVVRSSAIAEDLEAQSFAGLYDTVLNINTWDFFLESILAIYESLNKTWVGEYEKSKSENAMAVIVQELVASASSGVVFMANPIDNRVDEAVINGSWGLGEGVVAGEVLADEWLYNKVSKTISSVKIQDKKHYVKTQENGIVLSPLTSEKSLVASLKESQLKVLMDTCKEV